MAADEKTGEADIFFSQLSGSAAEPARAAQYIRFLFAYRSIASRPVFVK